MANPTPVDNQGIPTAGAESLVNNAQAFQNASSGNLTFPRDLGMNGLSYWMSFSFYEYSRPMFAGNPILNDLGTIRLPLPNRMNEQQTITYEDEKMGMAMGSAINAAQSVGGSLGGAAAAAAFKSDVMQLGAAAVDSVAANKGVAAAAQFGGYAANPFLTVMFKNPQFKSHSLSWKLAPSNEQESLTLNKIINTFRFNSLPDAVAAGLLLTYPNIVQIKVSNASQDNFTYLFKPAVIKSFSVNWAPQGQPSFFGKTQAPTEVEISMEIGEIEFWLQRDYGEAKNAGRTNIDTIGRTITSLLR